MRAMSGWVIADISTSLPFSRSSAVSSRSNADRTEKQTSAPSGSERSIDSAMAPASRAWTHAAPAYAMCRGPRSRRWRGWTLRLQLELFADLGIFADQVTDTIKVAR
jgi:hypothetical protein